MKCIYKCVHFNHDLLWSSLGRRFIMKCIYTILIVVLFFFVVHPQNAFKVYFNEVRANDTSTDDLEFIELIGPADTDITTFQIVHYNGSETSDGGIWTHTVGSFTIPDDGVTDNEGNPMGFYVVGSASVMNVDESADWKNDNLQNGPDGLVLYDSFGNILDAIAWEGAGDMETDDPGTVTTSGATSADNYLHVISDDDADDNSLQAPSDVLGDDGTGWILDVATPGALNTNQISGDVSLPVQLSSFTATAGDSKVILRWITESETDNVGFEIVRAADKNGEYQLISSYINNDALKGQLNSSTRSVYTFTDRLVRNDLTYWYKLVDVSLNGERAYHGPISVTPCEMNNEVIHIDPGILPENFNLYQNYPNPFNPNTIIQFDIPSLTAPIATWATLAVYNGIGQLVKVLHQGEIEAGRYQVEWDGSNEIGANVPNGVYFAVLRADFYQNAIKMVLLR